MKKIKILLLSDDIIGKNMAGPGIRVWEMACSFSREKDFEVGIACPDFSQVNTKDYPELNIFKYSPRKENELIGFASQFDIFILTGYILHKFPRLTNLNKFIIADLYIPFILENLSVFRWHTENGENLEANSSGPSGLCCVQVGGLLI